MNRALLALCAALLLGTTVSGAGERDAGCGPGVYCGDSPDDDGDPCTPQPNDSRSSDYDESRDDAPCIDYDAQEWRVPVGDVEDSAGQFVAPGGDWRSLNGTVDGIPVVLLA